MTPWRRRRHRPASDWPVDTDSGAPHQIAVIAIGGFVGGLARYEIVKSWHVTPSGFPWPVFAVNTAGAFVLALLVVVCLEVIAPNRSLRPLIGTGFCGALTTFSSVVVSADELAAHGHLDTAAVYVVSSLCAGLAAAALGAAVARSLPPSAGRVALDDALSR